MAKVGRKGFFGAAVFLFLIFGFFQGKGYTDNFDAIVVPTLMDSKMDSWFKTPQESAPVINKVSTICRGQFFNIAIFFRNYALDKNNNADITYDFQMYDPSGKPTEDNGNNIAAYKGHVENPNVLLLNEQQFLRVVLTDKYTLGSYKIKAVGHDNISGKSCVVESSVELVLFSLGDKFGSKEKVGAWIMGYHRSPQPQRSINALLESVPTDPAGIQKNLSTLAFFRRIFEDNPFLWDEALKIFDKFSLEEKKKLLLVYALVPKDKSVLPEKMDESLTSFYNQAESIKIPSTDKAITTADQLDVLWSEFLASGTYVPIQKIVSALALSEYRGTIDKIKSKEIKEVTKEVKDRAMLDAVYQSAIWSLISNCKQMPLVFNYCGYMYESEKLDENIKKQLGTILSLVHKELKKKTQNEKISNNK